MLMVSPRVYYAMARDGLFFPAFAAVDPSRGTPTRAVAIQAVLASALAVTGSFDQILAYFMVPTVVFVSLTVAAVFVLRRGSSTVAPLRTPGYPVSPLLFLVSGPDAHRLSDPGRSHASLDRTLRRRAGSTRLRLGGGMRPPATAAPPASRPPFR